MGTWISYSEHAKHGKRTLGIHDRKCAFAKKGFLRLSPKVSLFVFVKQGSLISLSNLDDNVSLRNKVSCVCVQLDTDVS